ncbi:hypothetical protein ACFQHO_44825 [Actinomadura yumaensis]
MEILSRARVGIDISAEDATRELAQIRAELDRTSQGAEVHVRADIAAALAGIDRFQQQIDRLDHDDVHVDVDVDVDRANRGLGALTAVSGLARKGLGALSGAVGLLKFAPVALGAVQLVNALGPLLGLAAALPAVLAAKTAALGTLKLALYGVSDAFSAALTGDAAEFSESLEKLSPAARSVATELRTLKPTLLGVQQAAQQALFAPLRGELTRLTASLAGPVRAGVKGVAAELGLAGLSVARFARSGAGVSAVRSVFSGTETAIRRLRPAMQPVLAGLAAFAAQGAGSLGSIAGLVAKVAAGFGSWLQRMAAAGKVQEWISGALAVAQQLGGVLADVGGIVAKVFQAMSAAGGGALGVIGVVLDEVNKFLSSAEGSQALTGFFSGLGGITQALAPLLPLLGSVVAELVKGLLPIARALSPVISVLVGAIGTIVRALVPILVPLGQVIASLVSGLLPILQPIITLIAQTAAQIGQALVGALTASLPSLQQIVLAVASLLPALMPLVPLWSQWLTAILPLLPALVQLAALLIGYLVPPLRFLITLAVGIVSTWMGLLIPVFRLLVTVITWLAGLVGPMLSGLAAAFRWLGQAGVWLWQNALAPAFRGIATVAQWLFTFVSVVLIAPLVIAFRLIAAVARWLWTAVIGPVFRAIGSVISSVYNAVVRPVLNAFAAIFRNVVAPTVRWIYNNVIRPVWTSVGSVIRSVYDNVVRPTFDRLRSAVSSLAGYFRSAVGAIGKAWDGLKSAAKKPVAFVINSVWNGGIVRMWNAVAKLVPGTKQLGEIKGFARGGVVGPGQYGVLPGYAPGRDTMLAAVSPGEGWIRPDATRALGGGFIHGINAAAARGGTSAAARYLTSAGGPRFGLGGIVGDFLNSAKDLFTGGLVKTATKAFNPMLGLAQRTVGGTPFGQLAVGAARGLVGKILAFFKPLEAKIGGDGGKVVKVAEKYVGLSGNPNRFTQRMGMNGLPWCGMFVDGVFSEAGAKKALRGVGGTALVANYRSLPRVSQGAKKAGDLGLYRGDAGHINIFTGRGAITIGGNESNSVRKQSGYINSASSIRRPRFGLGGIVPDILAQDRAENRAGTTPGATRLLRGIAGQPTHDEGGWLPPGLNLVANYTRRPEAVLPQRDLNAMAGAARIGTAGGTTYVVYPREHTLTEAGLERMTRRQDALARIGRPV